MVEALETWYTTDYIPHHRLGKSMQLFDLWILQQRGESRTMHAISLGLPFFVLQLDNVEDIVCSQALIRVH